MSTDFQGGGSQQSESFEEIKKQYKREGDICSGAKATDLDYSQTRRYGNVIESAETHIRRRHINLTSGASQYDTDPRVGPNEMFKHVKILNAMTFAAGVGQKLAGETGFVFVFTFPVLPHPIYPRTMMAWIGIDRQTKGRTRTNTLFVGPDCKTVQTSHPGFPTLPGFGPNEDNP